MKKTHIIFSLLVATLGSLACTACQSGEDGTWQESDVALSLHPSVTNMGKQENITRAATNDFFQTGDKISVDVTTNRAGATPSTYLYSLGADGIFTGDFRFNLDNTYIQTLKARWPDDEVRGEGVVLDQRKLEDYQKADRLIALSENVNIMPTAESVPLIFKHEQSRFSFRMAGQNANGLNILSVILELQYDDPDDGKTENISGAFWAYCDNTEMAKLILVPGIQIKSGSNTGDFQIVNDRYMIGMAEVGNATTKYTGGIWLKKDVNVTLAANTDYLVTLTPEGYDLIATIEIHGFGQDEGFIGVPSKPSNP